MSDMTPHNMPLGMDSLSSRSADTSSTSNSSNNIRSSACLPGYSSKQLQFRSRDRERGCPLDRHSRYVLWVLGAFQPREKQQRVDTTQLAEDRIKEPSLCDGATSFVTPLSPLLPSSSSPKQVPFVLLFLNATDFVCHS